MDVRTYAELVAREERELAEIKQKLREGERALRRILDMRGIVDPVERRDAEAGLRALRERYNELRLDTFERQVCAHNGIDEYTLSPSDDDDSYD